MGVKYLNAHLSVTLVKGRKRNVVLVVVVVVVVVVVEVVMNMNSHYRESNQGNMNSRRPIKLGPSTLFEICPESSINPFIPEFLMWTLPSSNLDGTIVLNMDLGQKLNK